MYNICKKKKRASTFVPLLNSFVRKLRYHITNVYTVEEKTEVSCYIPLQEKQKVLYYMTFF